MSNLEPEQVKQAESASSSPENAPESAEKKEESALYYTKWQQRMMKKGYVVTPKVKKPAKQNAMEWIATLVGALLLVLLLKAFVGSPVVVDGNSMYPTLHNGEIMIMSKLHYGTSYFFNQPIVLGGEPERIEAEVSGNILKNVKSVIVPNTGGTNFVKRVVGLPGDTVQISGGYLYVNGVKYTEKFLSARMYSDYGPYIVPEGHYFLMGDNRNNSNDSRSSHVGAVPRNMILGKVEAVLWHQIPSTLDDWGLAND